MAAASIVMIAISYLVLTCLVMIYPLQFYLMALSPFAPMAGRIFLANKDKVAFVVKCVWGIATAFLFLILVLTVVI